MSYRTNRTTGGTFHVQNQMSAIDRQIREKSISVRMQWFVDNLYNTKLNGTGQRLYRELVASDNDARRFFMGQMKLLMSEQEGKSDYERQREVDAVMSLVDGIFYDAMMKFTHGEVKGKVLSPQSLGKIALPYQRYAAPVSEPEPEPEIEQVEVKAQKQLRCQNCSAPLERFPGARFTKCKYCGKTTTFVQS